MSALTATAYAPATVANLGAGFDILGLALSEPGDTVIAELTDQPGVTLLGITGDDGKLPLEPMKNTTCVAAHHVLQSVAPGKGVAIRLHKGLPLASGLGSSSSSAVAGAVATNAVLGNPLTRRELLPACVEAEAIVSGRHADNVAPALLGGIVLVTGITPESIHALPVPSDLHLAIVSPAVLVPTAEARAVLPATVPLKTMVHQTAQVAQIIHALHTNDTPLLAQAVGQDAVVEPARAHLMPFLMEVQQLAKNSGALCTVISGAGPTLCSFCQTAEDAEFVCTELAEFYAQKGIATLSQATTVGTEGARILRS